MYTQCSNCRATFRVTMKELTTAQGLLRCGECDVIFDAMKTLSTALPEERLISHSNLLLPSAPKTSLWSKVTKLFKRSVPPTNENNPLPPTAPYNGRREKKRASWWLAISLICLTLLLFLQLVYSTRYWLAQQPLTQPIVATLCQWVDCNLEQRDLKSIKMLSRNVFSHPNSPEFLIIKASLQNEANFPQKYPYVEISFLNSASEVVALRRFKPEEYLEPTIEPIMQPYQPRELSLNIKDPGPDAVRFQFRFL
ncbi:MAG: zinc-ribbon and DUF3426 domain-containing protein [Thiofilum sp.]|uniref:zinc-ribbon and DUF3426 domain-containing protein n=1 Tax=Thiofilum sp. TaxID=2212733 RepID=UPI0025F81C3C|nr:zinc-ribbon and DUF3426 domain-containing protein [Thiofilum sp.]MBK8453937.1 DUF3426 domain-containing protein [Thiofilum sp.]